MKRLLCLATALFAALSVQAITANWTHVTPNGPSAPGAGSGFGLSGTSDRSATLAAAITYGGSVGSGVVLSFGVGGPARNLNATVDATGKYALTYGSAMDDSGFALTPGEDVFAKAGGTQIVALTARDNNGSMTIQMSVDGKVIATMTSMDTAGFGKTQWGSAVGGGHPSYSATATYDVWMVTGTGGDAYLDADTIKKDITALSLPEPTALALLALGVAGLALRRKAA